MGISYTPRIITGIRLDFLQQPELLEFLKRHGYPISDEELSQIEDEGWESFPDLKNVKFEIECMDGWSGHGWTIGFDGDAPEHREIMQAAFPNCTIKVFQYVQMN